MSINLPLPLLGEMAIFVKVVETGSFSEAARQLGSSPSAVSRSISRLEKALATRLLQRTTRKLRLSDGGEEVFKRLPGNGQCRAVSDGNQWSVHG
ncbi:UNVERIFIED_ORG: DNA-binding transcriptional LysR family regulator [Pseudomonas reinekei]|nr:DNA-binding transcriptional LysR family regulator [Pseudomonas reinekei]